MITWTHWPFIEENPPITGVSPSQSTSNAEFDVFLVASMNKLLNNQPNSSDLKCFDYLVILL